MERQVKYMNKVDIVPPTLVVWSKKKLKKMVKEKVMVSDIIDVTYTGSWRTIEA